MQKRIAYATAAVAMFGVFGCASIVKHPEVDKVKKVALISVTVNRVYKDLDAKSGGATSGLAMMGAIGGKKSDEEAKANPKDEDNRVQMANYIRDKYAQELGKIREWQFVSADAITKSTEYAALTKVNGGDSGAGRALASLANNIIGLNWATPRGMAPLQFYENNMKEEKRAALRAMCKKYGVDGLIVVDANIAFKGGFLSVGGNGLANVYISTSTQMINSDGNVAVMFPNAENGERYEGNKQVAMVLHSVPPTSELETALHSAIDASAANTVAKIREGLDKK